VGKLTRPLSTRPFGFALKIKYGGNILPLAVTVTATVILFVESDEAR
jgi:hypothetical protein